MVEWHKHKRIVQFLEYMVGGGVYFWGGMVVFALCYSWGGWPWWLSKGLADVAGWTANYGIQRYWAFFDKRLAGRDGRTIRRFALVNGIDLVIDYALVSIVIIFGFTPYVGFFVSAAFTTVWDYMWYRFWVFKP